MKETALVTGASSGIGEAIAAELAAAGFDVVLVARRKERLGALAQKLEHERGIKAHVVAADLGTLDGARAMVDAVAKLGVTVDFLVNNAGFGAYGKASDIGTERTLEMVALNVTTLTFLTQHYLAEMVPRGRGRILQISSVGAFQPSPFYAVYSATKSFVLSYSEALHHELRGTGVTVTSSCPGLTETEFHAVADHEKPDWMKSATMSAEAVARISVRAAMRGKRVVVPGAMNWWMSVMAQVLPKRMVIATAAATMQKR
jgi:uncharacterized protein